MEIIASLLIIITGVATIFTIYGFCIMYYDLVKKSAVIGIVCGILAVTLFFVINTRQLKPMNQFKKKFNLSQKIYTNLFLVVLLM